MFVDEAKRGGLVIAAVWVEPSDTEDCRRQLRELRLKGQKRIHFTKERDSRRRLLVAKMSRLPARVDIYDAAAIKDARAARTRALLGLAERAAIVRASRLIIEQDDSLVHADRRTLFTVLRGTGVTYLHQRPSTEPLLWIADAMAWCWQHGPQWRARIEPMVRDVRRF